MSNATPKLIDKFISIFSSSLLSLSSPLILLLVADVDAEAPADITPLVRLSAAVATFFLSNRRCSASGSGMAVGEKKKKENKSL
jgi:hypothetical protein